MTSLLAKTIADFETQLAVKVAVGATTGSIASNVDDDGVTIPDGVYYFTIDKGNSRKEYFFATLTGTALSNIKSISRQGVQTTGAVREHRVGANVIISDFAHIMRVVELLSGVTPLDGSTPLGYDVAPSLSDGKQLATVAYVLSVVTGGTVNFSTQSYTGTSGEALAARDLVYFKESDQRWWKVDADLSATFDQVQLGINQAVVAGAGVGVTVTVLGLASGFTGLTAGAKYYASNTAGAISTTPGTTEVFIGVAISTTVLRFTPGSIYMPTAAEKSAISGLATFTGAMVPTNRRVAPTGWAFLLGQAVSRTGIYASLFQAWCPQGVFTVTIASPAVFTKVAHTLVAGDIVHFTTTGALPTGLATNTDYYVIATGLTADAFQVSTTRGGSAVNTTGSQSGVHTFYCTNDGKGDGSTTWLLPDMRKKTIVGYDTSDTKFDVLGTPNNYVGEVTHQLTTAEMPSHNHPGSFDRGSTNGSSNYLQNANGSGGSNTVNIGNTGGDGAHNNMPPYRPANWMVKL